MRSAFEPILGALTAARFTMTFVRGTDPTALAGHPAVVNLRPSHGYVSVRIERDGVLVYQHPHTVREIIARPLQQQLGRRFPDENHWGFAVAGPGFDDVIVRPAPLPPGRGRPRRFHLEPVPDADAPEVDLAELRPAEPPSDESAVIVDAGVYSELMHLRPFSTTAEEGGFLLGHVFRDRVRPGETLVRVSETLPVQQAGASMLQFAFTGESFLWAGRAIAGREPARGDGWTAPLRLVGWYHTHLFPGDSALGLSTADVELHTQTFRQTWQVAALVNIHEGPRKLRLYRPDGHVMRRLPYVLGYALAP
jgi:hypothetical protein